MATVAAVIATAIKRIYILCILFGNKPVIKYGSGRVLRVNVGSGSLLCESKLVPYNKIYLLCTIILNGICHAQLIKCLKQICDEQYLRLLGLDELR